MSTVRARTLVLRGIPRSRATSPKYEPSPISAMAEAFSNSTASSFDLARISAIPERMKNIPGSSSPTGSSSVSTGSEDECVLDSNACDICVYTPAGVFLRSGQIASSSLELNCKISLKSVIFRRYFRRIILELLEIRDSCRTSVSLSKIDSKFRKILKKKR